MITINVKKNIETKIKQNINNNPSFYSFLNYFIKNSVFFHKLNSAFIVVIQSCESEFRLLRDLATDV